MRGKYFVVIALYNRERNFFIQKEFFKIDQGWGLVGGWVKNGESIDQALNRIVEKETGNILVEAMPISLVENAYVSPDKKKVCHYGLAFLGRVMHDSVSTQNGVFSSSPQEFLRESDNKILMLGKKVLEHKVIEPPIGEVKEDISKLAKLINRYLIKPLTYNFSSKILTKAILENVLAVNKNGKAIVLDVACGDDKSIEKIADIVKLVVCNDISRQTLEKMSDFSLKKEIIFTNQNLLELDYNVKFDVVICKNVMHHMRGPEEIGLLLEILKKLGKRIIIMDIENPRKSFIARLRNDYYVKVLHDQGGLFVTYDQFSDIIKLYFNAKKIAGFAGN